MAVIGAEVIAGAAIVETRKRDHYQPCGLLCYGIPGYYDVEYVTLNGKRLEHVTSLNDVDGWVEYIGPIDPADKQRRLRPYHEKGEVRVYWLGST